jgi:hypothetical protein
MAVVGSLLISGFCLLAFARFAAKRPDQVSLGDRIFQVGSSKNLAKTADAKGPILFPDLVRDGLSRTLYLAHVSGTDWAALNALPPGSPNQCLVKPNVARKTLVDPCSGEVYGYDGLAASGRRLERFTTEVNPKGILSVDLNTPYPETLRRPIG